MIKNVILVFKVNDMSFYTTFYQKQLNAKHTGDVPFNPV